MSGLNLGIGLGIASTFAVFSSNAALEVAITSPTSPTSLTFASVTFSGTVSSPGATVTLYRDGLSTGITGTVVGSTWSATFTPDSSWAGNHSVTAVASQTGYSSGSSNSVSVTGAPAILASALIWIDSTQTTDSGNGTAASVLLDQSGNGANMTESSVGNGPVRRDAQNRRPRYLQFETPNVATTTNAALIALGNGVDKDMTIIEIWQPSSVNLSYRWAWGSTTVTTRFRAMRRTASSTSRDEVTIRDSVVNTTVASTAVCRLNPKITVTRFDAAANTVQYRVDGVNEAAAALSPGTAAVDIFTLGRWPTGGTPTNQSHIFLRHLLVYDSKLSDADVQSIETWGAPSVGIGWKGGFSTAASYGNASNAWLVIAVIGQSNGCGRDTNLYAGDGTTQHIYNLYQDGNVGLLAAEPSNVNTDSIWTIAETGGGSSMCRKLGERLRELGETRNILFVNACDGGTSAAAWSDDLTNPVPQMNTRIGTAKLMLDEALNAPNSELVTVVYQGESNSDTLANANDWPVQWALVLNELNTRYAAKYVKTKRHFIVNLPPTAWTLGPNWGDVRANITTFCTSTRTDCTEVQAPDGPWIPPADNLHIDASAQNALGVLVADAIAAAT